MSTQEILLEEIKHQPEPVLRELRHYLDVLKCQREAVAPMDGVVANTWKKLGPAPKIDYAAFLPPPDLCWPSHHETHL